MVFTSVSKGTFPGQSEGAGDNNRMRNIATKLGDFDGVARARRAHYLTQHPRECAPHSCTVRQYRYGYGYGYGYEYGNFLRAVRCV